jgi:hypothetical protein
MVKISFNISKELDDRLRKFNRKKGDLSVIGEKALSDWVTYAEELEKKTQYLAEGAKE